MIRLNKAQFYFSFLLSTLFLIGCLNISKNDLSEIHISGQIINPVSDIIKFKSTDSIFTANLQKTEILHFPFIQTHLCT